jgi:hypothetical protein
MGLAAALAVVFTSATGALAANLTPSFAPPAPWVDVAPVPEAPPVQDAAAVQTLLDDNQSRLSPDGDSYYNRRIKKILKPEGLTGMTSFGHTWARTPRASPSTGCGSSGTARPSTCWATARRCWCCAAKPTWSAPRWTAG